jgi:hypothetical protein
MLQTGLMLKILVSLAVLLGFLFAAEMIWRRAHYQDRAADCRRFGGVVIYGITEFSCAYDFSKPGKER